MSKVEWTCGHNANIMCGECFRQLALRTATFADLASGVRELALENLQLRKLLASREIDLSDIPEAGEEWFKKAERLNDELLR